MISGPNQEREGCYKLSLCSLNLSPGCSHGGNQNIPAPHLPANPQSAIPEQLNYGPPRSPKLGPPWEFLDTS